jgi:hypothetical protein
MQCNSFDRAADGKMDHLDDGSHPPGFGAADPWTARSDAWSRPQLYKPGASSIQKPRARWLPSVVALWCVTGPHSKRWPAFAMTQSRRTLKKCCPACIQLETRQMIEITRKQRRPDARYAAYGCSVGAVRFERLGFRQPFSHRLRADNPLR